MPRPRTGHAFFSDSQGTWIALVTHNDKRREPIPMRHIKREDEAGAKAFCALLSKRAKERGAVSADSTETCAEYFDRWVKARKLQGIRTTRDDEGRWKKWIAPHLEAMPIAEVTKRDLETLVSRIDRDVRDGKLAWKTALHVWGTVTKMFDDAHRSKALELRARTDNPAREVRGPDRGHNRVGAYLFPAELATLLASPKVPDRRKRLYAFAVYTGLRAGEIRALAWSDVHEDEGYILVHQATDYNTGKLKTTKTGGSRKVPIEPGLAPLLADLRDDGEGNVFLTLPHPSEWAWQLREDLKAAGVSRAELTTDTKTTRKLDFHDLRHTYGTWRAIRGDELTKISRAMGHSTTAMTEKYINEAESFDGRFGAVFGALEFSSGSVSAPRNHAKAGRPQRESNPR